MRFLDRCVNKIKCFKTKIRTTSDWQSNMFCATFPRSLPRNSFRIVTLLSNGLAAIFFQVIILGKHLLSQIAFLLKTPLDRNLKSFLND